MTMGMVTGECQGPNSVVGAPVINESNLSSLHFQEYIDGSIGGSFAFECSLLDVFSPTGETTIAILGHQWRLVRNF
jgi:hypothetical protein